MERNTLGGHGSSRMNEYAALTESVPKTQGKVVKAFGNLLYATFDGPIRQGEVAMVHLNGIKLKAEVIEIAGNEAKLQVFEDTRDVEFGTTVHFEQQLLEAELGPGLLTSILDGLQNPLEQVANASGFFLPRGLYLSPLDRHRRWDYEPSIKVGQKVQRGDALGSTQEGRFHHYVMVPFSLFGTYEITWVVPRGSYTIDTVIAKAKDASGKQYEFSMVQRWPIKAPLCCGERIKPDRMMDTGMRIIDTQFPVMQGRDFLFTGSFWSRKNGASAPSVQIFFRGYCDCGGVRRARRRSGRGAAGISSSDRSTYRRGVDGPYGDHLQYFFHAGGSARILSVHGNHDWRVLPPDGPGCLGSCRFHLPLGSSDARNVWTA